MARQAGALVHGAAEREHHAHGADAHVVQRHAAALRRPRAARVRRALAAVGPRASRIGDPVECGAEEPRVTAYALEAGAAVEGARAAGRAWRTAAAWRACRGAPARARATRNSCNA